MVEEVVGGMQSSGGEVKWGGVHGCIHHAAVSVERCCVCAAAPYSSVVVMMLSVLLSCHASHEGSAAVRGICSGGWGWGGGEPPWHLGWHLLASAAGCAAAGSTRYAV